MTLLDLEQDVYRRIGFADTPDLDVTNRIRMFLNQRHRRILSAVGMSKLTDGETTFTTVASQPRYALGHTIQAIIKIRDLTNDLTLEQRNLDWYRTMDPDAQSTTGTPELWIMGPQTAVATQPGGTGLWVASSDAADLAQVARIESVRTGGYIQKSVSAVLSGLTRVQFGTATNHQEVHKFYLSAVAVGDVSLYGAAVGGTELARIPSGHTSVRHLNIYLWSTPASALTYQVDYRRVIQDMAVATDTPLIPDDFHYLISLGARLDEYERMSDKRATEQAYLWDSGISKLRHHVLNSPDFLIVPGLDTAGHSRLGPYFPSGT